MRTVSFTECITADGSEIPARKPVEVGSRNPIDLQGFYTSKRWLFGISSINSRIVKGGVVIPLIFPKVPQSSLGILKGPLKNPTNGHFG